MNYPQFSKEIIELKNKDLELRNRLINEGKLFNGYNAEMEEVHLSNARRLQEMIRKIGYPNIDKVGAEASQAAWLIIQHAISLPDFMKDCLTLAQEEAVNKQIDPVNVAFLSDRIAMYEDRPQSYGTQFIDDKNGELIPYRLDAKIEIINTRRKSLGLNTVEERLEELKQQKIVDNESTKTKDQICQEKENYDNWRRKVGWISLQHESSLT